MGNTGPQLSPPLYSVSETYGSNLDAEEPSADGNQSYDLFHEYEFETRICSRTLVVCTAANVWDSTKRNSVPFQEGVLYDGAENEIPFIGKVITWVDDEQMRLRNVTLPGHLFEYGTVERSLRITQSAIFVRTIGVGTNGSRVVWVANYAAAAYFPAILDTNIRMEILALELSVQVGD